MHIWTTNFYDNSNVGLYAFATDKYCLIGYDLKQSLKEKIEKVLNVPVYFITICGTPLVGVFCTGNKNSLLVPSIAFDEELALLKHLKISYTVIKTRLTALGNNILCNDHGCIANPDFSDEALKEIKNALKVDVVKGQIAGLSIVGSAAVSNSTHCLVHRDANDSDIEMIRKILKVNIDTGTVNMASPYVRSGIVCNDNGIIMGDSSGGPEVSNADEALGYLGRFTE